MHSSCISSVVWLMSQAAAPEPCTYGVTGRIVDETTGEGVAEARVALGRADEAEPARTRSDEGGRFTLTDVCPGRYALTIERADYETEERTLVVRSTQTLDVAVTPRHVDRLDDVIVEAPAFERDDDARASTTLEGDALERTRGRSFADALAHMPGLAVLRSPTGTQGQPIIRGQPGRRNLILYDHVRLETQKWGLDHPPEIDPFSAARITVIKGPSGILYGPDAIGGVVLVDPPPLPTDPGVTGEATLVGVSNGRRGTAALRVEGTHRRAPGFAWRIDGNATRGAGLVTPRYPLDNTATLAWNTGVSLGYRREAFEVSFSYRRYFMKNGICTCLRIESREEFDASLQSGVPVNARLYRSDYRIERPRERVTHDFVRARARVRLGRAGDLTTTYAFQRNHRDEFDIVRSGVRGPQYSFLLDTHGLDTRFDHDAVPLGRGFTLVGTTGAAFMAQRNDYTSRETLIPDYRQWSGGVFLLERFVAERLELILGARYDGMQRDASLSERDYTGQSQAGRLDPGSCHARQGGGGRCRFAFHTGSASLGAIVRPVPRVPAFTIALDATTAARLPAVDEQYMNGSAPSFPVKGLGRSTIGVERTWGASLTVTYANTWLWTEGSAYVNDIQDYIYFAPRGFNTGIRGTLQLFEFTPVDALFYGGEYAVRVAPRAFPAALHANLSWVRARNLSDDSYLAFVPPDRYEVGFDVRIPDLWRFRRAHAGIVTTYVDRQRRYDLCVEPQLDTCDDFAEPPLAYVLLGAELGTDLPLGAQVLRFAAVGANLLNTRYRDYTNLLRYFADEPGFEVLLRMSLAFAITPKPS